MKINFEVSLKTLDGKDVENEGKPLTLKIVCLNALLVPQEGDHNLSGEEKMRRWLLAQRIHGNTELDISAEDISLLKSLIAKIYATLVVGQAWNLLEGK